LGLQPFKGGFIMMVYPWVSLAALMLAMLFMPKRLTLRENILVFASVGYLAWSSHLVMGVMINLYDFGRTEKVEFLDWLLITLAPSLITVLYLNLKKTDRYLLYAGTWTIVSFFFEWGLVQAGYMKNAGWKTWYSIPVYLMAYLLLPWFLNAVIRKSNQQNNFNEQDQRRRLILPFPFLRWFRRKEKVK
jgi:hypothetical protein